MSITSRAMPQPAPARRDHSGDERPDQGRVGQAGFEDACLKALENAGCPLGYDTTMPGAGSTIEQRATKWLRDGQVGASSRAIHDHMLGLTPKRGYYDHPTTRTI